jgi:ribosomal-protein-alanine N-acetyltransferase
MLTITQGFKPEYVNRIHELENACFSRAYRWNKHDLIAALEDTASNVWVGVYDNQIVGYVLVELEDSGTTGHVVSLCVDPAYRQQGFGKLLMDEVETFLQKEGVKKVRLEVQVDNPAQVLYFKLGYRVTGIKHRYYSNGTSAISMVKVFKKR